MKSITQRWMRQSRWSVLALVLFITPLVAQADSFKWDAKNEKLSVEVENWPLNLLLETINTTIGWEVFLEPGTNFTATAKFQNLPPGEGLRSLLGGLSYALVPQTNGPARLYVFHTTMKAATQRIGISKIAKIRPDGAKPIPNELIVTLNKSCDSIEKVASAVGAKVIGRVDSLNTYRLKFGSPEATQAALALLNAHECVASVDFNYELPKPKEMESAGSGASLPLEAKPIGADGVVTVGLVDTGGDPNAYCGLSGFMLPMISVVNTSPTASSSPGHGLSMAYTVVRGLSSVQGSSAGMAVRIQPVDVYGANATTTTFDVANGIYRAVNSGANPINLSLGTTGDSTFLQRVIQDAAAQGVVFFAAAGNEPVTTPTYPAAYPQVVAVTAGDRQGHIASYANYGSFVDAMAPGASMVCYNDQSWVVQGTSAATAFATGLAAGAVAQGLAANQAVTLVTNALPVGTTGN